MNNESNFNGSGAMPPGYAGIAGNDVPVGDALAKLVEQERARHAQSMEQQRQAAATQELRAPMPTTRSVTMRGPSEAIRSLMSSGLIAPDGSITAEGRAAGIDEKLVAEAAARTDDVPADAGTSKTNAEQPGQETPPKAEAVDVEADAAIEAVFNEHGPEAAAIYVDRLIAGGDIHADEAQVIAFEQAAVGKLQSMAVGLGFKNSESNMRLLSEKVRSDGRFIDATKSAALGDWSGFRSIMNDLYTEAAAASQTQLGR